MNIKSGVPPVVDGEIAVKGHGFHILLIWAAVALLCHPFAGHCTAGDAVFSNDGQRIYAIGNFENPRTLREVNLSDQTSRTIPLSQLPAQDNVRGITRSDGNKFFCITEKSLWTFDPRTNRLTKVCDAPKGGRFWHIAYDPKTHTLFVTASGEGSPLFMLKNGRELVSIYVRRHPHITSPVFTSDGEFFYAETGDLWSGEIESEEGRFSLSADRYAPLAYLETANTTPNGTGVSDIAVTRDAIYVQLFRMGGSGWGVLLQLPRPPKKNGNETVSSMAEVAVKELGRYKETLQGLKSLGEINRPAYLCASPDESRVYYIDEAEHKEYLITNGQTQELHLRTVDQTGPTATATSAGANASEPPNVMNTTASLTNDAASAFGEKEIQAISAAISTCSSLCTPTMWTFSIREWLAETASITHSRTVRNRE
jgi:hypothetical protein